MRNSADIPDRELVNLAIEAMANSYSPYSKFRVGAALVTGSGRAYSGTNVENASYGLTVCAERVALFKAVSEGEREITRLAVVSSSEEPVFPCGACRQVLNEFSTKLTVVITSGGGALERHTLDKLLPHAFGGKSLPTK